MARHATVRHLNDNTGHPVRLPRVSSPDAALAAPGWTVYTEPGPIPLAALWLLRSLCRGGFVLIRWAFRGLIRLLVGPGLTDPAGPVSGRG